MLALQGSCLRRWLRGWLREIEDTLQNPMSQKRDMEHLVVIYSDLATRQCSRELSNRPIALAESLLCLYPTLSLESA